MNEFLTGLTHLVLLAVLLQLAAPEEMQKALLALIRLAVGLWILQFFLQMAGHKLL